MNFLTTPDNEAPDHAITFDDICAAAGRLSGVAVRTPLIESPLLNRELGFRVLIKAEPLQRTGSFKFRGAYNTVSQLDGDARKAGVIAFSSGNHAQGVAAAASMLGVPATIVMPSDAPAIKIANTRAWGAEVLLYDRQNEDREAIAARVAAESGATLIRPYDDARVIAGQGTAGLEIAEQAEELGTEIDAVVVPCGGGGLSSGVAVAMARTSAETRIWTAEPEGWDDAARSLAAGDRLSVDAPPATICDALMTPSPGKLTFPILRDRSARGVAVSEDAVQRAMAGAFRHFKLVVEPGGAAALAAVLEGQVDCGGRTIVCICSGGNADAALFADVLRQYGA